MRICLSIMESIDSLVTREVCVSTVGLPLLYEKEIPTGIAREESQFQETEAKWRS